MANAPKIAAIVLAAGQSRRSGPVNKLLHPVGGTAMVRGVIDVLAQTLVTPLIVVTGFEASRIEMALTDRSVTFAHNSKFEGGMGGSIGCGVSALQDDVDGVLICLADMPHIKSITITALTNAFKADGICVPLMKGKRGNPVLFSRCFFPALGEIRGDKGGKKVMLNNAYLVHEVNVDDRGIFIDHDTVGEENSEI